MLITQTYKYFVDRFQIIFPNDAVPLSIDPVMVRGLTLENNYDDDFFPLMRIDISLKQEDARRLIAEKDGVRFKLVVRKREYNQDNVVRTELFLNDTFIVFMDEDTPFFEESQVVGTRSDSGDNPGLADTAISLYLFREGDLLSTKKIINNVLADVSLTDTVGYLFAVTKDIKRVLFAPPDNPRIYKELLLPPQTIIGNTLYLHNRYGMYRTGLTLFFGLERTYIIPRQAKAVAWEKGEQTQMEIRISRPQSDQASVTGHKLDTDTGLIATRVSHDTLTVTAPTIIQDQIEGNHRIFINSRYNQRITEKNNVMQRGTGSYKLVRMKYPDNPYVRTSEAERMKTSARVITLTAKDLNLSLITPNKQFLLKFDQTKINQQYGGLYRLASIQTAFSGGGEDMTAVSILKFQP